MKTRIRMYRYAITIVTVAFFTFRSTAQHDLLGTTDIKAYVRSVPGLPATTGEAARRAYGLKPLELDPAALDQFYRNCEDKATVRIEEYRQYLTAKRQAVDNTAAVYQEQALKNINSNPIIANMGGYDEISQMSEEEAQAAAIKAAAEFTANPYAGQANQSEGMRKLYQKIASDPAYAKRFEKMSEAEKEAELRRYMAADRPTAQSPAQVAEQKRRTEAMQQQADRIRFAQEVQLKLAALHEQLADAQLQYGQKINAIEQDGQNHQVIGQEIESRYQLIPLVELGEYGRDHDPAQVKILRLEEAGLQLERAREELPQYAGAFDELAEAYQAVVSDYQAFILEFSDHIYGGVSAEDLMNGVNTELPLLEFEAALLGLTLDLSKQAKELTRRIAVWEQHLLETRRTYNE